MPQLDNKTFVIVGGTTGLGLSAARAFVAAGAKVLVVGRNSENVEAATASLGQAGRGLAGDATQPHTATLSRRPPSYPTNLAAHPTDHPDPDNELHQPLRQLSIL